MHFEKCRENMLKEGGWDTFYHFGSAAAWCVVISRRGWIQSTRIFTHLRWYGLQTGGTVRWWGKDLRTEWIFLLLGSNPSGVTQNTEASRWYGTGGKPTYLSGRSSIIGRSVANGCPESPDTLRITTDGWRTHWFNFESLRLFFLYSRSFNGVFQRSHCSEMIENRH